ncbi:putative ribonuclease H-like domain-containing protein [Tanacetum coccineum]|uniref:Ribonuclease H-like domain-containing protein n=1 Tax=Tanacetum coccineum TaxID=301880 RepID=A0ABQ5D485_9ASTR
MDDPNMTMEEYIKFEEEKAHRCGRVFNWRIAKYGKIRIDDDLHDLRSVEAEFPAIVINDAFALQDALSCKYQVSTPVNDEIDFRILFDESDDKGYTIIYDKNLFSYKMIYVNNLKTDSENDNEKADIVYNDALTSKSDCLTEQTLNPRHNNESDLNDETSLPEYNVVGQNILYFNDLFPFNIIHPNDLKSDDDNDNKEIDIIQSSEDLSPLPLCEQRHPFLRYQGLEYTDVDIADFKERLERIYSREIHRVQVMDFVGMPKLMRDGLFARMVMEHRDDAGVVVFTSRAWRRLFDTRGPLVKELILEWSQETIELEAVYSGLGLHTGEEMESPSFARYWSESERMIPGKGDLHDYWRGISTDGDFLGPPSSYTLIRDPVLRLCHRMMAHSIVGGVRHLKRFATRRKSGAHISGGQFVARLAEHFGLLTVKILRGLMVITHELLIIDMGELEDVHAIRRELTEQCEVIDAIARDFSRFSTWAVTGFARMMDRAGVTYVPYSETHVPYQRRPRERISTNIGGEFTNLEDLDEPLTNFGTNEVSTASGDFGVSTARGTSQIDEDDLEELDLRWQVAMLTVRCYNCHRKGHFARECRSGRNQGKRSYGDNGRSNAPTNESSSQALVAQDGLGGYDWSNDFEIEPVNYALMAISSSSSSSSSDNEVQKCSKQCLESFKTLQKNYDSEREKHSRARLEIQGYELALESLESRILVHEKNELAWGEKYEFQNYELKCREIKINNLNLELEKVVKERDELKLKIEKWEESSKNLDELLNSQMSARDKTGLGYGTQLNEMSNNFETDSEISLSVFDVRSSDEESTPANDRFSKADGYHADPPPITGNFLTPRADISFAGLDEYAIRKKIIESKTTDQNTKPSETVGKRNEANTQKPKIVYESVNRDKVIIEDWNSYNEDDVSEMQTVSPVKTNETQTVKTRVDNIVQTSHKQGIGVLTRTGLITPVKQNEKKAVHKVSTARLVSTVRQFSPKIAQTSGSIRLIYPRMDNVRPRGSYLPIKRSYYTKPAFRPKDLKQDVKTFRVQNNTTAGTRAVVNTGKGKMDTDLKKSRWVWRPKGSYLDHVSKDSGSFMLKKFEYVDPKGISKSDHAVVDNGCFIRITGNKAYLSDYEDYNGGFVAFGSDPKGGTQDSYVVGSSGKDKEPSQEYILLPLHPHMTRIPIEDDDQVLHDELEKMIAQEVIAKALMMQQDKLLKKKRGILHLKRGQLKLPFLTNLVLVGHCCTASAHMLVSAEYSQVQYDFDAISNDGIFNGACDDKNVGVAADFNNMYATINVSPIPTLRIHKDHLKDQILGDPKSAVQTRGKIQRHSSAPTSIGEATSQTE